MQRISAGSVLKK